jgi:excisionase family DNA binding protein
MVRGHDLATRVRDDRLMARIKEPGQPATARSGGRSATVVDRLEPLLTITEVAAYLGVPVKTLYAWRYRRLGPPALRVGRHVRYRRSDLEGWVQQRITEAGQDLFR